MDSVQRTGRIIGILLLLQIILGATVNFGLLGPTVTGASAFLANAAPNHYRLSIAALLMIVIAFVSITISITAWPVFKRHSERHALAYVGLTVAGLALAALEGTTIMSMLSISKQYVDASEADARLFEVVGGVVRYGRYWAHYAHLLIGSCTFLVFYTMLFRSKLVPTVISGFGILAVCVQMVGLAMPFFGNPVNFYLLAPMGLGLLTLAVWLLVKGFTEHEAVETE
jgi:hypothetical protein